MTDRTPPTADAPFVINHSITRDAIVAFIDAHRAERRLYPESYADRMTVFIDEAHRDGVPSALRRLRKELPK